MVASELVDGRWMDEFVDKLIDEFMDGWVDNIKLQRKLNGIRVDVCTNESLWVKGYRIKHVSNLFLVSNLVKVKIFQHY
jgi:hypothetical protein